MDDVKSIQQPRKKGQKQDSKPTFNMRKFAAINKENGGELISAILFFQFPDSRHGLQLQHIAHQCNYCTVAAGKHQACAPSRKGLWIEIELAISNHAVYQSHTSWNPEPQTSTN